MEIIQKGMAYILSFQPYVMLPVIMLVLALLFRMRPGKAVVASLTIGIGFIGIFTVFDVFVGAIGPAIKSIVGRTGMHQNILDAGWTPLAAITWAWKLAPAMILLLLLLNGLMLVLKLTDTVNVDIWNFWHFIFLGAVIDYRTGNTPLAVGSALLMAAVTIKLADWSKKRLQAFSGMEGIVVTTISGTAYYPLGVLGNRLLDRIPVIRSLHADPEHIRKKLGLLGEPMIIGLLIGLGLGAGAGYDIRLVAETAFKVAAVVYILPMMTGILGKGLVPISEALSAFLRSRWPHMKDKSIGLDVAVILGNPAVIVTGLILMPVSLFLAFVLPGVGFIPVGDLPNCMCVASMIVVAVRGNVVRAVILCIPVLIAKLYFATAMASDYTAMATGAHFSVKGYEGTFTSFLDGGNAMRFLLIQISSGQPVALLTGAALTVITGIWMYRKKVAVRETEG